MEEPADKVDQDETTDRGSQSVQIVAAKSMPKKTATNPSSHLTKDLATNAASLDTLQVAANQVDVLRGRSRTDRTEQTTTLDA